MSNLLKRSVQSIIPSESGFLKLLGTKKKLNIYLGIDPTVNKIHIGHAIALRKLNEFAKLGHNVYFLIGDYTALIGDTSDKDKERPVLSQAEIKENLKTYRRQASKFLDFKRVHVVRNSKWLSRLKFSDLIKLTSNFSVGDFVSRDLIKRRLSQGSRVGLHETLYPVMQGYDSYYLDTDLQIGGIDQTFNMLSGRDLIKNLKGKESFVMCVEYLPGLDGAKMSKTSGNAIWVEDSPKDIYGKIMSLPDNLVETYFHLATNLDEEDIKNIYDISKVSVNPPLFLKHKLAHRVTTELAGKEAADIEGEMFVKTFSNKDPDYEIEYFDSDNSRLLDQSLSLGYSKSQLKRMIIDNGVDVNGKTLSDFGYNLSDGDRVKIGKQKFVKFIKK